MKGSSLWVLIARSSLRRGIGQAVHSLPDHKTLLTNIRSEDEGAPAAAGLKLPAKPKLGKPIIPPPTVPLPGQAAPMKSVIVNKRGQGRALDY